MLCWSPVIDLLEEYWWFVCALMPVTFEHRERKKGKHTHSCFVHAPALVVVCRSIPGFLCSPSFHRIDFVSPFYTLCVNVPPRGCVRFAPFLVCARLCLSRLVFVSSLMSCPLPLCVSVFGILLWVTPDSVYIFFVVSRF